MTDDDVDKLHLDRMAAEEETQDWRTCQQCMQDHRPDRIVQIHMWEAGEKVPQLFGMKTGDVDGIEIAPHFGCPLCVPPVAIMRAFPQNMESARPWIYAQVQWQSGRLSERVWRKEYAE